MANPFIQTSFNSGEWAPNLWARTDLEKYKSGAALLENFFVDYRGGATTRSGTKYIIRGKSDSDEIRLIPFQAAIAVGYVLQFGEQYIRFLRNGAPVLETGLNITGASKASACVVTVTNTYSPGDWVYISGVGGMTQLNGKYYIVSAASGTDITLQDLFSNNVNSTGYTTYTTGGTVQRIYTIASPYSASDLATLKYSQNVDTLILTHTSYAPQVLTFTSATSWTIVPISFGTVVGKPTISSVTSSGGAGSANYSYIVTTVDINGQESEPSTAFALASKDDMRTVAISVTVTWGAISGAIYYNVYKAEIRMGAAVPAGAAYGYIGYATGTAFIDSNIIADFSITPPVPQNPFQGAGLDSITVTAAGTYTSVPTVTIGAAPSGGYTATAAAVLTVQGTPTISSGSSAYVVGESVTFSNGVVLIVATVDGGGAILTFQPITFPGSSAGAIISGSTPANPVAVIGAKGGSANLTWGVGSISVTYAGAGYLSAPAVSFSSGAATATAVLATATAGAPAVSCFFQQRLVMGGQTVSPAQLNFSQPGNYYNFNNTNPIQEDNAIQSTIVASQLNNIKALIPQAGGLIVYSDDGTTLINGGALGAAVTPTTITANAQSHVGCNDMPPIVSNFDILTVQSKGSSVRDSTYNFYANVYTGTDISVLASHLFFGYQLTEWAWAEEPYKLVWAVRNDGALLSLTFLKEQEFTAWAHHVTEDGDATFNSVATIVEAASVGYQNFVYTVVGRTIGATAVQYIEYFPERPVSTSAQDYWTVDCSISYSGSATTSFQGGEFLAGKTCTGLADGSPITPFVMASNGNFTLGTAASNVKVGLAFDCNLQTLYIDLGAPTVQSKMKQLPVVVLRVTDALGLEIGSDSSNLVAIKDLVVGQVGSMTNEVVTDLVTGDTQTILDPKWQEAGQIYIRQPNPYPATILGYIPKVNVGQDNEK